MRRDVFRPESVDVRDGRFARRPGAQYGHGVTRRLLASLAFEYATENGDAVRAFARRQVTETSTERGADST
jgi:hypothetical protein